MQPIQASTLMRALGDPTRLSVFEHLCRNGEAPVVDLTRVAGVSQPAVSQHLRALREAGLVRERRVGRNVIYCAEPSGLAPLFDWLDHYSGFWRTHFAALKHALNEIDTDGQDQ